MSAGQVPLRVYVLVSKTTSRFYFRECGFQPFIKLDSCSISVCPMNAKEYLTIGVVLRKMGQQMVGECVSLLSSPYPSPTC